MSELLPTAARLQPDGTLVGGDLQHQEPKHEPVLLHSIGKVAEAAINRWF